MQLCIGIISYLPSDERLRVRRWDKLVNLIYTCNKLLNLDIVIEAQCWTYLEKSIMTSNFNNVTIHYNQDKLGIAGARRKLREHFLQSPYDVIIMLDDDCELKGTKEGAQEYLNQIFNNPNMFYEHNGTLLKLFAISKEVFKEVDFEDKEPDKDLVFEDRIFVGKLRNKLPEKRYIFKRSDLQDYSISTKDRDSTWYDKQDVKQMLDNTSEFLKSCC